MIAVVGPTATGKSDLAVTLAGELQGEVINADAFQLYRGMDIGTAKLPLRQRRGIPHHLLDVLDICQDASVAAYQRAAQELSQQVSARGRMPLLVGGSGLYVRAVVDDLVFPGTDPVVRQEVEERLAGLSDNEVHALLAELDPVAAAAIEPGNRRRLVRALEVIELTGEPFSANLPDYSRPVVKQVGLEVTDTGLLDEVVARRVRRMVDEGFVAEVEALEQQGLSGTRTASRAIGYPQMLAHLRGEATLEEAVAATVLATRQLIRKQRKWFRRDPRIQWFDALDPDLVQKVADAITG